MEMALSHYSDSPESPPLDPCALTSLCHMHCTALHFRLQTGTEIDEVVPPGESRSIRLREAGSPMTSLWPSYVGPASAVVVVVVVVVVFAVGILVVGCYIQGQEFGVLVECGLWVIAPSLPSPLLACRYFPEARGVVYVLDLSQPLGISGAIMELFDVLSHPGTAGKPFALVLNKG